MAAANAAREMNGLAHVYPDTDFFFLAEQLDKLADEHLTRLSCPGGKCAPASSRVAESPVTAAGALPYGEQYSHEG